MKKCTLVLFIFFIAACNTAKVEDFSKQQIKLSQIVVLIKKDSITERAMAFQEMQRIEQKLKTGFNFGRLAREESHHKKSARRDGDIGWFKPLFLSRWKCCYTQITVPTNSNLKVPT